MRFFVFDYRNTLLLTLYLSFCLQCKLSLKFVEVLTSFRFVSILEVVGCVTLYVTKSQYFYNIQKVYLN
jgi:hypothetical protein